MIGDGPKLRLVPHRSEFRPFRLRRSIPHCLLCVFSVGGCGAGCRRAASSARHVACLARLYVNASRRGIREEKLLDQSRGRLLVVTHTVLPPGPEAHTESRGESADCNPVDAPELMAVCGRSLSMRRAVVRWSFVAHHFGPYGATPELYRLTLLRRCCFVACPRGPPVTI
jgi:hypothetical protein